MKSMPFHLHLEPNLGKLTEDEFIEALVQQYMMEICLFEEDGKPVLIGPLPVELIKLIAETSARCVRSYDSKRRFSLIESQYKTGKIHQNE